MAGTGALAGRALPRTACRGLSGVRGGPRRSARGPARCAAHTITVLPGDGIGPEISAVAVRVLHRAGELDGTRFHVQEALIGGAAIDATGQPLPPETLETCRRSDAVLLAAIGGYITQDIAHDDETWCESQQIGNECRGSQVQMGQPLICRSARGRPP